DLCCACAAAPWGGVAAVVGVTANAAPLNISAAMMLADKTLLRWFISNPLRNFRWQVELLSGRVALNVFRVRQRFRDEVNPLYLFICSRLRLRPLFHCGGRIGRHSNRFRPCLCTNSGEWMPREALCVVAK